ncbi:uncharacterized protein EAF01_006554 [Botrytis porri]|uniref:uncharacterized protein n=1 Tax=Botrytis porri TaxID=87229 RepID=UPI0018FF9DE2|nr:uncharacterized protein EAF01_006554 [Botrytis porri]KAF7903505.1 hypothetical protein EAF01_006554 [Botrytis porri]
MEASIGALLESYSPFELDKSRLDRWPDFKSFSIEWGPRTSHGSLSINQHIEMLVDVPFLKTALDRLPDAIYRLQSRSNGKIGEVEKMQLCTKCVTDLAETFKRLLDVGDVQPYSKPLIYMFTILSPYIQKLQIEIKSSGGYDSGRPWRSQIFPEASHLKFILLKEFHHVTVSARRSKPERGHFHINTFRRTARSFCENTYPEEIETPWLCIQPIDGSVTPQFLDKLMEGIFVQENSLESLSLIGIRRSISDHTHLGENDIQLVFLVC